MPVIKEYVTTTVGRGYVNRTHRGLKNVHVNRHVQRGGNPLLMGLAGAVLPSLIGPLLQPIIGNIGKVLTGNGTQLAGRGKRRHCGCGKKKRHSH